MTSGVRGYDMALRLQYDDVPVDQVEPDLDPALDAFLAAHPDEPKRIFCTYTAMMALRRMLAARYDLPDIGEEASVTIQPTPGHPRRRHPGRARGLGAVVPDAERAGKGAIHLVHLYPREMSIYGDLGNTRALAARIRRHGYSPVVHQHHPGRRVPRAEPHLVVGGGGQDSGQVRVEADLEQIADRLRGLADAGTPMLMICGMYQLFGNAFITVEGKRLPGLGILDVTTQGNAKRMIGPVVLEHGVRRRRRLREPLRLDDPRRGPGGRSARCAPASATTAPTAPRAHALATSSAPTCTARSCRPTPRSPTP